MFRSIATLGLVLALSGPAVAAHHPPLTTQRGVVAADHPLASEVGARVLAEGGNAVDAAVATALALGVVNPTSSGIGGGGFALVYIAKERKLYAIDFRELAPAAITPDHYRRGGKVDTSLSQVGGLAVAVPGEVAGLAYLIDKFGARPWRSAVAPAEQLARKGFPAGGFLAAMAASFASGALPDDPWFSTWLARGGAPIAAGQVVKRPKLARTLAWIGRRGRDGFYRGWVADDIVATAAASGGVLTAADLAGYQAVEREPLIGTWRGLQVATMPLPSSGGLIVLETLGILDAAGVDLAAAGAGSSAAFHVIAEALKHAFADRARFLGDADYTAIDPGAMLAPARLSKLAARIGRKVIAHDDYGDRALGKPSAPPARGGGTSHLCAIDADGNAVALTTTVNGTFGALIVGKKSGIVLNNEMDDFSLAAGVPNMFGLVQSDANLVGPGKRPLSSMSPTLVLRNGQVVACVGGSGGPRIITNVVHALLHVFVFGMDARAAVSAPRIHHQWSPDRLLVEKEVPADVVRALRGRGHAVTDGWETISAVQMIVVRPDGTREAASDPRKQGAPAAEPEKRGLKRARSGSD